MPDWILRLLLWCGVVLVVIAGLWGTRPPRAVGPEAPLASFSAARAMSHLAKFAKRPHPIGSPENAKVREYLTEALTQLGGEVRIEKTVGFYSRRRFIRMGNVQNIVARYPGEKNQGAVMLVAHYDSVSVGPGAADDGAGVISILETVRALRAGAPFQNDLIVLFTDGEETGLLGASGFVADHPDLAKQVGVVLNLEARGSSGPALMFETSRQNGWLVPEFARAAPYPMASSLMYAVYQLLPNDTDLSELKASGVAALNFAFTESFENYHSRRDNVANLDPRSVQHLGGNVLGVARHFLGLPRDDRKKPDCVYFNWLGDRLIVYPRWVAWALVAASLALFILGLWLLDRRGEKFSFLGAISSIFVVLAVSAGMLVAWSLLKVALPVPLQRGDTPSNQFIFAGLVLIGLASGMAVLRWMSAKIGPRSLQAGLIFMLMILNAAVCFLLPGGSYLFQWPILVGLISLFLVLSTRTPGKMALASSVSAAPTLLLLSPLMYLLVVNLDLNAISILAAGLLLAISLSVAWPFFDFAAGKLRPFSIITIVLGLVLIFSGAVLAPASAEHPRRDDLTYVVSANQQQARWLSDDAKPDRWTRPYLGEQPEDGAQPAFTGTARAFLSASAPMQALPPPVAEVLDDRREGEGRHLRLHLQSRRGGSTILMRLPIEVEVESVSWNGRRQKVHGSNREAWLIRAEAVPSEGVEVELEVRGQGPLPCWLADSTAGLPEVTTRPDDLMAEANSDVTIVVREQTF
ncbi:MAG: M28 family peptidase [Verrucomicrobiota bacterium]